MADQGIVLYAIHIGGSSIPDDLYGLSQPTGGEVFRADNPESLRTVFARIDDMKPVELEPVTATEVDAAWPVAVVGLAICALFQIASFGWRFTPW